MNQFYTESTPDPTPPPKSNIRHFLRDMLETIFLSIILFLIINALSARIRVESISMQPTLFEGNFVLVNRLAYQIGEPQRGDVIIFRFPLNPDREPYIKRVIGLPGDTVRIEDGSVTINDVQQHETYIKADPAYSGEWIVPAGNLFVLGDNRNNSSDSHSWGFVPLGNVVGKALVVYWPPENWQMLHPNTALAASEP